MKTLKELIETSPLIINIVKRELNNNLPVFLIQNLRTNNMMLCSQPSLFDGKFESNSMGILCGNEDGMGGDELSTPLDTINTIDELTNLLSKGN